MSSFKVLVNDILDKNIGIIQLPCPEISFYGMKRWGHVKDQFETPHFRKQSKNIIENIVENVVEYKNNGYEILGVIGVKGSPSCGVSQTCRGEWYGKDKSIKNMFNTVRKCESGAFMEVVESSLIDEGIEVDFYDSFEDFQQVIGVLSYSIPAEKEAG